MTQPAPIKIEESKFEKKLKQSLISDLCFRGVIWATISLLTAFIAIHQLPVDPLTYLERLGDSLTRLLNWLGSFALIISIPAIMSKDLEASIKDEKRKRFMNGWVAGFFRRLASDLTLWTLGALITLLTSLIAVMTQVPLKCTDYLPVIFTISWLVGLAAAVSVANIWVRTPSPTPHVGGWSPWGVAALYLAVLVFICYFGVFRFF